MLAHSRLALRPATTSKVSLAPLTRHLLPTVAVAFSSRPHAHANYYSTSTSGSSASSADIISAWKTSILKKPTLLERDTIRPQTLQMLSMTLSKSTPSSSTDSFPNGSPLPVNWHHAFFPPMIGESDLGQDGYEMTHAPPAPFLARMWAGGGVEQNPANLLRVGQEMVMKTRCTGVDVKEGREGKVMVFVSLEKVVENQFGVALTDTRTLVYMEKDKEGGPVKPKLVKPRRQADVSMEVHPTAIQLFRYSALTFNSHRIHFDHEYANNVEDHPACLVHGPLSATLLLEPLRQSLLQPNQVIKNFRYRALSPLYVDQPIKICAKQMALIPTMDADVEASYEVWVENPQGGLAMSGTVEVVQEQ
ncbi:hypothetical protein BGZ91_011479 [Linnemannia elongata]|nr:hypothetical protein BGZ91_011479 [Linnemannia elongata]KAG0065078.1 hypothetical protein BGZ90_001935 [Linnemannia elongata]